MAEPLHVMPKPIGPMCNLDCAYCYYLNKQELYSSGQHWRMSDATLERFIRQYLAAQPPEVDEPVFGWQGGEPTLMGIDFYRRAVELQKLHTPADKRCANTIQTNGVLLDDEWCEFFKANGFLVGISIDGPADLHDKYRRDKSGQPTFDQALRGATCLREHGVEFNALTVVNRHNSSHPRRVYRLLKELGVEFVQFIPLVERGHGVSDRSVGPRQFGRFLIEVFDEWVRHDVGQVFIQIFDEALAAWMGLEPSLCIFRKQCGRALVLEHNGDVFSCDHFVDAAHKLGNIHEASLAELAASAEQQRFGQNKEATLPQCCRACSVRFICNGECPKNRFAKTPTGEDGLNYLCEGYKMFFAHIDPFMRAMAQELFHSRPAANVMHGLAAERQRHRPAHAPGQGRVGRNDPCPCGSGRKFKRCCGLGGEAASGE